MDQISKDLRIMLRTHTGTRSFKPKVVAKKIGLTSTSSSVSDNSLGFNFDRIVGCDSAKQMLYENIVLPLSLSGEEKNSVFTGALLVCNWKNESPQRYCINRDSSWNGKCIAPWTTRLSSQQDFIIITLV
jgi:hypothetical protein